MLVVSMVIYLNVLLHQLKAVPNHSVNSKNEKAILQSLEEGIPKSMKDIEKVLPDQGPNSEVIAKETAWKLVEEGKARFNSDWLLEARPIHKHHEKE